ncbi:hypothetical protein QUF80_06055 [Desulfococcaceae bacterium HSG8]|nr:hypothetical protein [Desulfococcaceae bacterium HSG8]
MGDRRRWPFICLRKYATFHDGEPITSDDIAFFIGTVKQHPFSTMLAAVALVETPDPFTAIARLKQPTRQKQEGASKTLLILSQ